MSLSDLDPTGTLAAATSAIKLVGQIARVAPALKGAANARSSVGPNALQRSSTAPGATISAAKKDPERERRAYETVNFVLREFGSRLCAAGLVNEHALTKALMAASQHVDVKLFSGEANRLFQSLAPKLADPLLVNSVFTAIYFIGVLISELTRSLPTYKETTSLGPKMVQQLFRTAIGEGAFRENLTANLDAYETLAVTAGLLRPTDPDYATFPGFPAFSPSRFSNRSMSESWSNKSAYDKLCKHLSRAGFPQPVPAIKAEIGIIGDWRFLMSDTNTQSHDIDKADKIIGENFGRVLYWLVCAADRLPPGQAIIVVHDQHLELIRWIGPRLGYRILQPASDLDLTGAHMKLDGRLKSIINSWLVLVFSEPARAAKQATSEKWNEERAAAAAKLAKAAPVAPQPASPPALASGPPQRAASTASQASTIQSSASQRRVSMAPMQGQTLHEVALQPYEIEVNNINQWFNAQLKPQCQVFIKMPPSNPQARELEHKRLTDLTEKEIFFKLDALSIPDGHFARVQRKAIVDQAQQMLATVDAYARVGSEASEKIPISPGSPGGASPSSEAMHRLSISSTQTPPLTSPPPYSPGSSGNPLAAVPPKTATPPTKIRRKAPPPPRKPTAKALYDFVPEDGDEEELAFREGDELEIVEKTAALEAEGWCKVKIKGTTKIGLAPLEYLDFAPVPAPAPSKPSAPAASSVAQPASVQPDPSSQSHGSTTTGVPAAHNEVPHSAGSDPMLKPGIPAGSSVAQPTEAQLGSGTQSHGPAITSPSTANQVPQPTDSGPATKPTATATPAPQDAAKPPGAQKPIEFKQKLGTGGKIGVAIAGVGAATGVAALLQNQQGGNSSGSGQHQHLPHSQHQMQNPQPNHQYMQDQGAAAEYQSQANTIQMSGQGQNTTGFPQDTSTSTVPPASSDTYFDAQSGQTTDLSALDGGFQPDPSLVSPDPVAGQATVNPYFPAQDPVLVAAPDSNSTLVMQDPTVSPFAAIATPVGDSGFVGGEGLASPFAGVAGSNAPVAITEEDVLVVETDPVTGDTVMEEDVFVEEDVGGAGGFDDGGGFEFE